MTDTNTTFTPGNADNLKSFADFGVQAPICEALADAGITSPFPIQELTLPLALAGADLIGQARTGTGKTLAFGIPLLQRVDVTQRKTQALVVVPTRELCFQVAEDLTKASVNLDLEVVAVYGGKALEPQAKAVENGAHVVVGTPGRLLDLLRRGSLTLSGVQALVLDEADEMLDLGFLPDVEQLIQATAEGRQTLLFSATMPSAVVALARRYMHKPTFLRADVEEVHVAPKTKQYFFSCHRMDKPAVLARVLTTPNRGLCVVFTRTKRMADVLAEELRERGVKAAPIHSDLRQEAREKALERFRKGTITVLVATEVAARGLDIDDVTHVVNYDCPEDEKMYLHRIGRTGRAGADGVAITMALWNELARLEMIKKTLDITEPTHEVFSTSPILDELFNLPPRDSARRAPVQDDDEDDLVEEAKAMLAADAAKPRAKAEPKAAEPRAAAKPEARDSDPADDDQGEGRKRRRRGGRGRGARRDDTGDDTATQQPEQAPAREPKAAPEREVATDEPAEADQQDGARRTRTRTRRVAERPAAGSREASSEDAKRADEAPAASKTARDDDGGDGDGGDGEIVRVRRRTRVAGSTRPADTAARTTERPAREPRAPREPREAGQARGAQSERGARGARGGARSTESGSRETRSTEARSTEGRSTEGRSTEGRSGQSRGAGRGEGQSTRGGERGRDGRGRDPRGRDPRGRDPRGRGREADRRRETSDVDVEAARDGARPVISRPLKIEHIP